ncbi:hypothetical protein FACS1894182_08620 [Bacteroidia bacterium]|nr:hypothetical protein FACS1894182_08620 [Bacteroidia bacterium]
MDTVMKKYLFIITIYCSIASSFVSCTDELLKKPFGSDLDVEKIFSSKEVALSAISEAYFRSLMSGITLKGSGDWNWGLNGGTLSNLSGELCNNGAANWVGVATITNGGYSASRPTDDNFGFNYKAIKQCFLVIENIDRVPDMTADEKNAVKAEMKTLIAYRYEEMFKRYGGVPIVNKSLTLEDDMMIPRSGLQELLDYIITLCDEAYVDLPDTYPDAFKGRVTKGVALAIKAEALIYAARPLFNSAAPYMDLGADNQLICFGNYSEQRWRDAAAASEAVIQWAANHGYYIINTGSPLDDYGTAVSTPNNPEIILAYKRTGDDIYSCRTQTGAAQGMSYNLLTQYLKADGTEQAWPADDVERTYSEYATKIQEMEPRYKASAGAAGIDPWNNPNDESWRSYRLSGIPSWFNSGKNCEYCGRRVKFFYHAGNRTWMEFPIYRLAEFYLNIAEAANETGDTDAALSKLNVIRERAGFGGNSITERDRTKLRKIIQREWAVEFYEESHRLHDVKHWKLEDIGNGIIGGAQRGFFYTYNKSEPPFYDTNYITYSVQKRYDATWAPYMHLNPFPQSEVNKGYLIQNPGY